MKNPKVMIVQMEVVPLNPKRNIDKIKKYFEIAGKNNCDFIVFPEKFDGILGIDDYIENHPKKFINTICKLSKKYSIYAIAGSLIEKRESKFYNTSYFIGRDGKIKGKYDKIALFHYTESKELEKGNSYPIFDTEFGKIGIIICRDMLYPQITSNLAEKGAKIIFCPIFWSYYSNLYDENDNKLINEFPIDADFNALKVLPMARAIENEVCFICANAAGSYKEDKIVNGINIKDYYFEKLAGHSSISMPLLGRFKKIDTYEQDYLVSEINLTFIDDSKNTFAVKDNDPKKLILN